MRALKLGRKITGVLFVFLAALALGVAPACSSDDEAEETQDTGVYDEVDGDGPGEIR